MSENTTVDIQIPFPTNRLAQIAYDVLRVEKEPKRSGIQKEISVNDNILFVKFSGSFARQLRVAVTNFFENVHLIVSTIDFAGPPVSDSYSHF